MTRATGKDDPVLAETSWPMPGDRSTEVAYRLIWGGASVSDLTFASSVMAAYRALICDSTTEQQQHRLAALRRVYRKRAKP